MHRLAVLIFLFHEECVVEGPFDPPETPAHSVSEDGVMHARGNTTPFLCGGDECPTGRPADEDLSCDAAGCHGTFTYDGDNDVGRQLHGADGPSCFTCHEQEWSARVR